MILIIFPIKHIFWMRKKLLHTQTYAFIDIYQNSIQIVPFLQFNYVPNSFRIVGEYLPNMSGDQF